MHFIILFIYGFFNKLLYEIKLFAVRLNFLNYSEPYYLSIKQIFFYFTTLV